MSYKKFGDRDFASLFANHRFKKAYSDYIIGLLRRLYQPLNMWGKLLGDEGNYGVINTDISLDKAPMSVQVREFYKRVHDNKDPKWSLLNYVNTHWTSFMIIVNVVNYWIDTNQIKNEDYFTFKDDPLKELDRLKVILNKTGEYLFMPQQNLKSFWKIMSAIATSTYIGNIGESLTLDSLSNLGKISDVIKSKPGMKIDILEGVDLQFKLNGVKKTLQCKVFYDMKHVNGYYYFNNISNPKMYDVDYFSFVSKKNVYVFLTREKNLVYRFKENTRTYIFDEKLLKYKIDI